MHSYKPPQYYRETQRLGIIWLSWTLPFPYSDDHRVGTEVIERSEAGQNLATGKRMVVLMKATGSPRR